LVIILSVQADMTIYDTIPLHQPNHGRVVRILREGHGDAGGDVDGGVMVNPIGPQVHVDGHVLGGVEGTITAIAAAVDLSRGDEWK